MQNKLIFTTLFNSFYLCKGLTMYKSLCQVCEDFHLYLFAYDDKSFDFLIQQGYKNVTILSLSDLETYYPELLEVKRDRTFAEYCWTTTPFTISYCLANYNIDHCVYIDADLFFLSNPNVLIDELINDDVLITEHRYTQCYDQSLTSGKYCVQFIAVRNTENGRSIINWWKSACHTWCYNRYEDGKFGDQKYLDDWTTRFNGVHVLQHFGTLAPWNIQQYSLKRSANKLVAYEYSSNKIFIPVLYHFHYLRTSKILNFYEYIFGPYELSRAVIKLVYKPYIKMMMSIHSNLLQHGFSDAELGYNSLNLKKWRKPFHLIRTFYRKNKSIRYY